ncbi:hypothetical protein ACFWC2_15170 [Streptomyces diastaticus]|uniref:hypothetical protein n=1 Tax=Streptomyces diastaticus TaxID=1956 RepID=UPI0036474F43
MDSDDELLLRGRVYGHDPAAPEASPLPGHHYAELVGGPLDGLLLDITGHPPTTRRQGAALPTALSRYGPDGRSLYKPRPTAPSRWDWQGDTR